MRVWVLVCGSGVCVCVRACAPTHTVGYGSRRPSELLTPIRIADVHMYTDMYTVATIHNGYW